jgi:hypothetical protein
MSSTGIDPTLLEGRHSGVKQIARVFEYGHLSGTPRTISQMCCEMAEEMISALPDDPELTVGLRKLGDAKDAFVRTAIWNQPV